MIFKRELDFPVLSQLFCQGKGIGFESGARPCFLITFVSDKLEISDYFLNGRGVFTILEPYLTFVNMQATELQGFYPRNN